MSVGGDQSKIIGLNSGTRASERQKLAAQAQLSANISAQIGALQAQTDALSQLVAQLDLLNRPRGDAFARIWRYDLVGPGPSPPQLFELPQEQAWQIQRVIVWSHDSSGPKAPSAWLAGLTGLDPFPLASASLTALVVEVGIPVLGHTQELIAQAAGGTAATTRHTFVVRYTPISA